MEDQPPAAGAHRLNAWCFALLSAALAVGINAAVEACIGFDLSSVVMFVVIPVGTMALVAAGLSGFLLGVKKYWLHPGVVDLGFLMCLAFAIAASIHGYQYLLATAGLEAAHRPSFGSFVSNQITETMVEMHARGMPSDAPPVRAGGIGILVAIATLGALPAIAKVVHSIGVSWYINRPDTQV